MGVINRDDVIRILMDHSSGGECHCSIPAEDAPVRLPGELPHPPPAPGRWYGPHAALDCCWGPSTVFTELRADRQKWRSVREQTQEKQEVFGAF